MMTPEDQEIIDETTKLTGVLTRIINDMIQSGSRPEVLCRGLAVAIGYIIGNRITDNAERMAAARGLAHLIAETAMEEQRTLQ